MLMMIKMLMQIVTIFKASSLASNMFQSQAKMSKAQLIEIMKFELKVASVSKNRASLLSHDRSQSS